MKQVADHFGFGFWQTVEGQLYRLSDVKHVADQWGFMHLLTADGRLFVAL